jgi:pimeloyl-ACP methyl ester carboxylesterase
LEQTRTISLKIGYFGSSTGAGAALVAAAALNNVVAAIVSRGGRPDLAGDALKAVKAPTLLIVGAEDHDVIRLNEQAQNQLRCEKALRIIPGASHLFEEPGTLEKVAEIAAEWFERHLNQRSRSD